MTRLFTQKFGATVAAILVTIAVFQTIATGMQTTAGQSQTVASGAVESSVPRAVSRAPQAACLACRETLLIERLRCDAAERNDARSSALGEFSRLSPVEGAVQGSLSRPQ